MRDVARVSVRFEWRRSCSAPAAYTEAALADSDTDLREPVGILPSAARADPCPLHHRRHRPRHNSARASHPLRA